MKFTLSTFLLLVTCIALAIGLYVERAGNDERTERLVDGGMYWADSMQLQILHTDDPVQLANRIETDQVRQVLTVFRRASLIQEFNKFADRRKLIQRDYPTETLMADEHTPIRMASDILETLGCSSPDQYFDRMSNSFGTEIYAEFQQGGDQHSSFYRFLELCFSHLAE